jgi:hypothetical protein
MPEITERELEQLRFDSERLKKLEDSILHEWTKVENGLPPEYLEVEVLAKLHKGVCNTTFTVCAVYRYENQSSVGHWHLGYGMARHIRQYIAKGDYDDTLQNVVAWRRKRLEP